MTVFSLAIASGVALGLFWTVQRSPPRQALFSMDSGLAALAGALIASRLGFVAAQWAYFRVNPDEIMQFWLGGLSGSGALVGGALAALLSAWLAGRQPGRSADLLLPLGAALSAAAWLACWLDGAAYGAQSPAWWALPAGDEWGLYARRFPTQLLGALLALGWYALLEAGQGAGRPLNRLPEGGLAAVWLLGSGLSLFGLALLRGDPAQLWAGLRLEAWAALGVCLLALLGLGWAWLAARQQAQNGVESVQR